MSMIFLLALSFFHIGAFADGVKDFSPLGRGVYLPQFDVLGNLRESGSQILRSSVVPECTIKEKQDVSSRGFKFYKDTEEFYSSMTTASGLASSLRTDFSLGLTLDQASQNVGGTNRTVTGNSLYFVASYRQDMLDKDCLSYEKHFHERFLDSFQLLPVNITHPWIASHWKQYDVFLKKYGSHVITSISVGSMINQMAFAETSESYTEQDFQVKSCMFLGIPLEFNASMCSGIDKSEVSRVSKMSMGGDLVIQGGTAETRNELINNNRTADLIEKFMNEANATNATVQYKFTSTWDILESLYVGKDTDNFVRAVNLEYYYLGFLNYGCSYQTDGGQDLQMFNLAKGSSPTSPQYECSLAPKGCHSDHDCHFKLFRHCRCKGDSCIKYEDKTLDTGKKKKIARVNREHELSGHGCSYKASKAQCYCTHESKQRTTVWQRESKDVLYKAHHLNLKELVCDRKEA